MSEFTEQQSIGRNELVVAPPPRDVAPPLLSWLTGLREKLLLHAREIRKRLDEVIAGKVNWGGDFTLGSAATSTVVEDDRVSPDSEISLHALTADAASLLGKMHIDTTDLTPGTAYSASPIGRFTVRHPIVGTSNFKFRYSIKG
jgi:hypothetical protein